MMKTLRDIVSRDIPQPWTEGDNIPWNEPGFSRRMLKEHLSQDHDAASRRFDTIERHVEFIHEQVLRGRPSRILDLGCGPGLYSHRLARLGHTVHGIDFSPASVEYARQVAEAEGLSCSYTLSDMRRADYGPDSSYDLVMFIFGEFNVFSPRDARAILTKAHAALKPGGKLLLEPSTEESMQRMAAQPASWYSAQNGLFSEQPYLALHENYWDETRQVVTTRHIIIDASTTAVTRYTASYQMYAQADLRAVLEQVCYMDGKAIGFDAVTFFPSLTGEEGGDFWAVVASARP